MYLMKLGYTYTKARLVVFDGEYGLLEDHYGALIMFARSDVHNMDLRLMTPGVILLYNNWGLVEAAAGHFHRWNSSK